MDGAIHIARCSEQTRRKTVTQSHGATADPTLRQPGRQRFESTRTWRPFFLRPTFFLRPKGSPMTFKYKLSVRLALLKDALLLASVVALFACEKPAFVAGPSSVVTRVAITPPQVTLHPNQTSHFMAVGLTPRGDTTNVPVTWSATGGSIVDTFSTGSHHY